MKNSSLLRIQIFSIAILLGISIQTYASDCVILLHGLRRDAGSMSHIEDALLKQGYQVWNQSYDSAAADISAIANSAIDPAMQFCASAENTHFVTHSLGGILVRDYLQGKPFNSRIIMIGSPNHGSQIPDKLGHSKIIQKILGPVGMQLGANQSGFLHKLQPIQGEIGIIVGNRTSDPWFSWMIPGPDDGKISVESAKLIEMKEFIIVPYGHIFIMRNTDVIEQILLFIKGGAFNPENISNKFPDTYSSLNK